MISPLRKKLNRKKWGAAYDEKLKAVHDKLGQERMIVDKGIFGAAKGANSVKKFAVSLKSKLQAKLDAARDAEMHLRANIPTVEWRKHWGSSYHCSICEQNAVTDIRFCKFCNRVAHRLCVMETMKKRKKQILLPKAETADGDDDSDNKESLGVDRFVCTTCEESRKVDQVYYDKCKEKHRLEKIQDFYRDMIARKMLAFWRQKCYRRKKRVFIRIQAFVRRRMAIKEYELWKRSQRRVVIVELSTLPKYVDNSGKYLIVVTVVDPIKRCQLFRIDKKAEVVKSEGFLLPGINAYVDIWVTICTRKDDFHYFAHAQAQFVIRDNLNLFQKKAYTINFSKTITCLPQDLKRELVVTHILPPALAINTAPVTLHQLASLPPSSELATLPTHTRMMLASGKLSHSSLVPDHGDAGTIWYEPQNPISSRCLMVHGPPADVLRKLAELNKVTSNTVAVEKSIKMKLEVQSRRRKWWLVLSDLRLYFFDIYGEAKPKLVIDVTNAEAIIRKESAFPSRVSMVHDHGHVWHIDCASEEEAIKLHFSLIETRRCVTTETSIYMRCPDVLAGRRRELGFTHVVPGMM